MSNQPNVVDFALFFKDHGFQPIAVYGPKVDPSGAIVGCQCGKPECPALGKHPIGTGWQGQDWESARESIRTHPGCNLGCATGGPSRLLIIDADVGPDKDGPGALKRLEEELGTLPATPSVRTGGGGLQVYFRWPEGRPMPGNGVGTLAPGLDIRGEGGQGVLPPSLHRSGRKYEWIQSPADVAIADVPEAWQGRILAAAQPRGARVAVAKLSREASPDTRARLESKGYTDDRLHDLALAYVESVPGAIAGQGGNAATFAMACWLVGHLPTWDLAWRLLVEWNDKCDPPWNAEAEYGPDSLRRVLASAVERLEGEAGGSPFALRRLEETTPASPNVRLDLLDWGAAPATTVRVPDHPDHRFRGKPIGHSGRSRSPIPEQANR